MENYLKIGLKYLRAKNYEKATEYLSANHIFRMNSQSYEALFSALISHSLFLKESRKSRTDIIEKLEYLINTGKSPYETIGLPYSTLTKAKLIKRYKILTFLFCPDSDEAFLKINTAYASLQGFLNTQNSDFRFTEANSDCGDLWNFYDDKEEACCGVNPFLIFSLFPMGMLFFVSVYSSFEMVGKDFSLYPTSFFTKSMVSSKYKVTYWIYPEDIDRIKNIEVQAEAQWVIELIGLCQLQSYKKMQFAENALVSDGETMNKYFTMANQVDMSSCDILDSYSIIYDFY